MVCACYTQKTYRRKKNVKKGLKKIVASFLTVAMTAVALDFSGGQR